MQCLVRLPWPAYAEPEHEFSRSINIKNCAEMAVYQDFVKTISGLWYE